MGGEEGSVGGEEGSVGGEEGSAGSGDSEASCAGMSPNAEATAGMQRRKAIRPEND